MVEGNKDQQSISSHETDDDDGSGTLAEHLSPQIPNLRFSIRQMMLSLGIPDDEEKLKNRFQTDWNTFSQNGGSREEVLLRMLSYYELKIEMSK